MRRIISLLIVIGAFGLAGEAAAMTVTALEQAMKSRNAVTIIDVRDSFEFEQGHIPGAINIPASVCPMRRLPPLGKVVVYDDGLGRNGLARLNSAAAALGAKPGIAVQILDGGYAAWESAHGLTTAGRGARPETFNYITYQQLQTASPNDVLLVDLRKRTKNTLKYAPSLTDLSHEFPGRRISAVLPEPSKANALIVLIDSADGSAEAAARRLKAAGAHRYVVLAGGELSILRKGKAGLARSSQVFQLGAKPNARGAQTNR